MGITPEQFDQMLAAQGGACAVCGAVESLVIDHDHRCCSGRYACGSCVRALLCGACNSAEGMLRSDPSRARRLAEYMERWA